jgi:hypothetical protein
MVPGGGGTIPISATCISEAGKYRLAICSNKSSGKEAKDLLKKFEQCLDIIISE